MTIYGTTYSCGHSGTVTLYGKRTDREAVLNKLRQEGLCSECYALNHQSSDSAYAELAVVEARELAMKLPQLKGTLRQVAWARNLRNELVKSVLDYAKGIYTTIDINSLMLTFMFGTEGYHDMPTKLLAEIRGITEAKWYIDTRQISPNGLKPLEYLKLYFIKRHKEFTDNNWNRFFFWVLPPLEGTPAECTRAEYIRIHCLYAIQRYLQELSSLKTENAIRSYIKIRQPILPNGSDYWEAIAKDMADILLQQVQRIRTATWYLQYNTEPLDNLNTYAIFLELLQQYILNHKEY